MNLDIIRQKAYELMGTRKAHIEREAGGIYYHGQRTANVAIALRKHIIPDDNSKDEILIAACYLHDCAKGIEPHAKYGAIVAREALNGLAENEEINQICDLIEKHKDRNSNTQEINSFHKILQDADLIEHFGIYEIWMCFQYYAHTNGSLTDAIKFYEENHTAHTSTSRALLNYDIKR